MTKNETVFEKDLQNNRLSVTRVFDAPLGRVWRAWTESGQLDQWWAPKPYRAETKTLDFRPGGFWLYCMVSPGGERTWCKEHFRTIDPLKEITNSVSFCDEDGRETDDFPKMYWTKQFSEAGGRTTVHCEIRFDDKADMEKIIAMRFQDGFAAGLGNLEALLSAG